MKYSVLGGSGFLGSRIVEYLARENEIIVADLRPCDSFISNPNIRFVQFDYLQDASYSKILDGVDVVIHLVSTLFPEDGTENLTSAINDNLLPSIRLFEAMCQYSGIELLFVSSGGTVYGEGGLVPAKEVDSSHAYCSYALVKTFIENTLELYKHQHHLKYKVVRISNPYGANSNSERKQGLIPIIVDRMLKNQQFTIWGDGENIRDYIFIDDVVEAVGAVLTYDGTEEIFNIGSGEGYSINQVINLIQAKMGSCVFPNICYAHKRTCDLKKNVLDISKIAQYTNWKPKVTLNEGIVKMIELQRNFG